MYRQGRLYLRVIVAVAVLAVAVYSIAALAANPFAVPRIIKDNAYEAGL